MSSTRRGLSETPDGDLDLHQLHCRYAILWGADMKEANRLWETMKGHHADRGAHLAALSLQMGLVADSPGGFADRTTPDGAGLSIDDSLVKEGSPYRHLAIRYERSCIARETCIETYGRSCVV